MKKITTRRLNGDLELTEKQPASESNLSQTKTVFSKYMEEERLAGDLPLKGSAKHRVV